MKSEAEVLAVTTSFASKKYMIRKLLHVLTLFPLAMMAQNPIYQFAFDGTMNNTGSETVFGPWQSAGTGTISYVADRTGQANKAINLPNTVNFSAVANALPGGNAARTLSFWVKFINDTDNKTYPVVGWGTNTTANAFGFWRNGVQNSYYTWGVGNDYNIPQTNAQQQATNNGWVHIAMTHTGSTLTLYYNGVNAGSYNRTLSTIGTTLYLNRLVNSSSGSGDAIHLDDLRIYNTALTATEIQSLYNPTAVGSAPTLSNVSISSTSSNAVTLSYTINPGGASTQTDIVVTAFDAGIGAVYNPPAVTGSTAQQQTFTISGLTPGTCYTYYLQASNTAGTSMATSIQAFCTRDANQIKTPVYHFEFNGNTQDRNNPSVAFANPNSGYINNDTAIRLNNNVQSIVLPFLPQSDRPRTVAIRLRFESGALAQENQVFSYGTAAQSQSFGYTQNSASQATFYYWANDISFSNPLNFGTFYTLVFVYDGTDCKVYRDGVQIGLSTVIPNTVGTTFRIGRTTTGVGGFFNGSIDDLRIYNEALTATEVNQLTNTLSTSSFDSSSSFTLVPNPAHDLVRVVTEEQATYTVEITTLQGQLVSRQTQDYIDVSGLSKGIYLVSIYDENKRVGVKKLVVR